MANCVPEREKIAREYRWNLEDIYASEQDWERDFLELEQRAGNFAKFSGKLADRKALLEALQEYEAMEKLLDKLFPYARMRRDEDNRVDRYQALTSRAQSAMVKFSTETSFLTPELIRLPREFLASVLSDEAFEDFRVLLREIDRNREHTLSVEEERIIAMAGEMSAAPDTVYSMLTDADMKFPSVRNEEGESVELTQSNYIPLMMSKNREVRSAAFNALYETYQSFSATIPAIYEASIKADMFAARTARHASCLEAALFPDNVPVSVYDNLVQSVRGHLPMLNRFVARNGKRIGVEPMRMIDVYVPAVEGFDIRLPFDEAYKLVVDALGVLGRDYQDLLESARREGWIDVFENVGKSSGAYSWGSYCSHPFVLLNYKENLDSLLTIAHEMGHSLHTYFSNQAQPFLAAQYSLFVAEVASTTNEILVLFRLMERYQDDPKAQAFLTYHLLDSFRSTVFRQTMFAEFERSAHEMAERGEALTAQNLNAVYGALNAQYYTSVEQDKLISLEWMRIPHFYRAFYVYKYATGFSAAMALAVAIRDQGAPAVERYRKFLSLGCSLPPLEALKVAGVDMEDPQSVESALEEFDRLVERYEALTE